MVKQELKTAALLINESGKYCFTTVAIKVWSHERISFGFLSLVRWSFLFTLI